MTRTQTNALSLSQQPDPSISDEDYTVDLFKFHFLNIIISFQKIKQSSESIFESFDSTSSTGHRLLHDYPQYTQLCRSIRSILELNQQNRQTFEFSMIKIDVTLSIHTVLLHFKLFFPFLECLFNCCRNATTTR